MQTIRFDTIRQTSTEYAVGPGCLSRIDSVLSGKVCVVVADKVAADLHSIKIDAFTSRTHLLGTLLLSGGETAKSFETLQNILRFFKARDLPKHGVVIALGGGALCDVAALATMLMRRGLELILIPTTLLAQIDAAIGGKNAINLDFAKNFVGGFHQPSLVCCDQDFLLTLTRRQTICGIAEAVKVTTISDASVFQRYFSNPVTLSHLSSPQEWKEFIWDSMRCKLALLADDVYEQSEARLLNYGHIVGHLCEEVSRYGLSHGEAVLIGMIVENEISRGLGIGSEEALDHINAVIGRYITPVLSEYLYSWEEILPAFARLQRARCGLMNYVCVVTPGQATIVPETTLDQVGMAWTRALSFIGRRACL